MEKTDIISILEKWSSKYKRSINCNNPKGFSQKAHCAGRRKRKRGGKTKSRPVESIMENKMENLKEFVVKEIQGAVSKELTKKKLLPLETELMRCLFLLVLLTILSWVWLRDLLNPIRVFY